jgi:hypothetical protein
MAWSKTVSRLAGGGKAAEVILETEACAGCGSLDLTRRMGPSEGRRVCVVLDGSRWSADQKQFARMAGSETPSSATLVSSAMLHVQYCCWKGQLQGSESEV